MIKATKFSYMYTDVPIFDEASFSVGKGMKVGVVGQNGAGKSTLFNLIAKKDNVDSGTIVIEGSVALVPQEVKRDPELEKANSIKEYIDPQHKKEEFELLTMLRGLELGELDLGVVPRKLSGGQKTKLALARALILEPDILLLDEPTNFMDIQGKQWMMNFLSTYAKTLLLISHDLKLMDHAIDKVIFLNPWTKKTEEFSGNYSKFQELKKEQEERLKRQIITEQKHLKRMKESLIKMARYSSDKGVRQRTQLKKRIQRIEESLPDLPREVRSIKLKLPEPTWIGELPIRLHSISKSFGEKNVLENVSFSVRRHDRIALIGPNGAGKSTLIKILVGLLQPDAGEIIKDETLRIGYYSQEFETFDMSQTLIDTVRKASTLEDRIIRPLLGRFLFSGNKVFQKVETLSGGEKTRLAIALLLVNNYNLLVLDEPTTYLDVLSQRVILEALKEYKGTLLLVSHTEDFIKELQPTKALLLPQNRFAPWSEELLGKVAEI